MKRRSALAAMWVFGVVVFSGELLQGCAKAEAGKAAGPAPSGSTDQQISAPVRDPRSMAASRDYGDLYVSPGDLEAYASVQPWTSYWFPAKDPILWQPRKAGELAPLQKYDLYEKQVHGKITRAADWERDDFELDNADNWDGLCDAWSAASILVQPEPAKPAVLDGIAFDVVDLKALIVKSFQDLNGKKKIYGYKYTQEGIDDFQDIYPEQFHRILAAELIQKKQAFVIDKDPGIEVWNTPIAGAVVSIVADRENTHLVHVTARLEYAEFSEGDVNALGANLYWMDPPYTYDLYGNHMGDGRFKVAYGVWTGESVNIHPDFAVVLPKPSEVMDRRSFNPELDTSVVDEIVRRARLEGSYY